MTIEANKQTNSTMPVVQQIENKAIRLFKQAQNFMFLYIAVFKLNDTQFEISSFLSLLYSAQINDHWLFFYLHNYSSAEDRWQGKHCNLSNLFQQAAL